MASDPEHLNTEQSNSLSDVPRKAENETPGWIDNRTLITRLKYALFGLAILLLLVDPLVHKHGPLEIEHLWGFYGIYPLIGCAVLLIIARMLAFVLKRSEDYYDR